ncbi:MAG: hypothetical protein LLG20_13245 [Acidobacteriales bacterium]|nr:hypothetical protein [Terriglobales bacterium]
MKTITERRTWVSEARQEIAAVRQLLRSPGPDTYDRCRPRLELAIGYLERFEMAVRAEPFSNQQHARRELEGIRRELEQVTALINGAAAFYQGLGQIVAAAATGYTPAGHPGVWQPRARLAVEG